jgi:rubrerythrin
MDAYVRWREQCSAVSLVHSHWATAPRTEAHLWHRAYSAALDAEERACELYAELVRRAGDLSVEASLNMQLAADRG